MVKYSQLEIAGKISETLIASFLAAFDLVPIPYNMIIDHDAFYDEGKVHIEIYFESTYENT